MNGKRVNEILSRFEYTSCRPTRAEWDEFCEDISESDKEEAGKTWIPCWKTALSITYETSDHVFSVTSPNHQGASMFGLSFQNEHIGQIWLLQSKTFRRAAHEFHGSAWSALGTQMVRSMVAQAVRSRATLFNFIPANRSTNIRLLKLGGFTFFEDPRQASDMLLFGMGPAISMLGKNEGFWRNYLG